MNKKTSQTLYQMLSDSQAGRPLSGQDKIALMQYMEQMAREGLIADLRENLPDPDDVRRQLLHE